MKFHFVRNEESAHIDVEIESTGLVGGDGGYHKIKISNPNALNFILDDYDECNDKFYPRLNSLEVVMNGDWEVSETIDALKYIVKCLEEVKGGQHGKCETDK